MAIIKDDTSFNATVEELAKKSKRWRIGVLKCPIQSGPPQPRPAQGPNIYLLELNCGFFLHDGDGDVISDAEAVKGSDTEGLLGLSDEAPG